MKAALYVRVSTVEQSTEQQLNVLIEYCQKQGWEYEAFKDVLSGAKQSRPALDFMMQKVRAGGFDIVLVWKLDRLGRSTLHLMQLVEELNNKHIRFIALTQNIDTENVCCSTLQQAA